MVTSDLAGIAAAMAEAGVGAPAIVVIGNVVDVAAQVAHESAGARLDDPADERLADYVQLREVNLRRLLEEEHGLFIAEGDKVIRRAADAGYEPRSFLLAPRWLDSLQDVLEKWPDEPVYVVSEELAEQVTGFHVHRGALASYKRRAAVSR